MIQSRLSRKRNAEMSTSEPPSEPPASDRPAETAERSNAPEAHGTTRPAGTGAGHRVSIADLHAYYGATEAVKGVAIEFPPHEVTAIIGPSGCGKSTMVRCINRMHEEIPGARAEGKVMLDDQDVYASDIDVTAVRRLIGMVFQKPNPFPTMSIFDNVASGPQLTGTQGQRSERAWSTARCARSGYGTRSRTASARPASGSPAASSSDCASPGRSRSSPR